MRAPPELRRNAVADHYTRRYTDALRGPIGVLHGPLLGVVGLFLAFV